MRPLDPVLVAEYEARIAALERKGRPTHDGSWICKKKLRACIS